MDQQELEKTSQILETHTECRRLLVATDGSGQGFKAVGQGAHMALRTGAELTLMMVVDYDSSVSSWEQVSMSGYVPEELKLAARQYLEEFAEVIPARVKTHIRVAVGEAGEQIVQAAEEENTDIIVMGTRGLGTLKGMLLGSVSNYVLKHAPCNVMLVKGLPEGWTEEDNFRLQPNEE